MPVSGGDPARGREEVTAAAATLAAPAAPFNRGVAGNRRFMPATLVRASAVIVAAIAAACAACGGDARGVPSSEPLWSGSARSCRSQARSPLVDLAGVFSSEPLVAAAWDGRPVFRLAESLVESEDGRQLTVTLRSDIRFHTGDPDHGSGRARPSGEEGFGACRRFAGLVALDDRRLQFSLHKASSVKPEDLSTMLVDSNEPDRIGLRTGPFRLVSTEPRCSNDSTATTRGALGRADGDGRVPDASCGVDGHDAAGSEFPPRGQPRRHRLRRSRAATSAPTSC